MEYGKCRQILAGPIAGGWRLEAGAGRASLQASHAPRAVFRMLSCLARLGAPAFTSNVSECVVACRVVVSCLLFSFRNTGTR